MITTARASGFYKRKSKVSPPVFFDLLMYDVDTGRSKSLNQLAIETMSEHDIGVTKQGIDKKFNEHTLMFLKRLIEKQLLVELDNQIEAGWLSSFNRVTIKDGTRFELPEEYQDYLPGSGGSASKAGACLQFEFNIKSGQVIDLNLTPANRPDAKDALEVLDTVAKNDLVIRDLGYFVLDSLSNISEKEAYYISRFNPQMCVFEMKRGLLKRLNFKTLYSQMTKSRLVRICKYVWIGSKVKMPLRMIFELLPDQVYEQRVRKIQKSHNKKGRSLSEEYKFLCRFNIYITNVSKAILPDEVISALYRIRWQIELIFKIWKSVIGIHNTRKMKYLRWVCLLYFKLLVMIINWNIILSYRNHLYNAKGRLLSLNKCYKTLFDNTYRLRDAIKTGSRGILKFVLWIEKILNENHWLERKNKSKGLEKILYLFYCKSNIYVYI